jgi:adenylylsulfate kinase
MVAKKRRPSPSKLRYPADIEKRIEEPSLPRIATAAIKQISQYKQNMNKPHPTFAIWLTGLSGAGKSSLASELERKLRDVTPQVIVLDGDKMRTGLCSDLGFGLEDRKENMRRVAEVAKLFVDAGWIVITALISPLAADRLLARDIVGEEKFVEVYCKCSVEACASRDVKGLYRLALAGKISEFTGISSPYEPPLSPALVLDTETASLQDCVENLFGFLSETRRLVA